MNTAEESVVHSMTAATWRFYVWVTLLGLFVIVGLSGYIIQLRRGLIATGLRDEVSWGLYIASLVFWVGVSEGGAILSAVLRVTGAEWRRPVTRMAEAITLLALLPAFPMIIADLGRPGRMLYLFRYGRIQSPLVWDVIAMVTYLIVCALYLYLPLIPDLALLAWCESLPAWRRKLYLWLALGWSGSLDQQRLLRRAIFIMALVIVPLAVSVCTILSWVFATTLRPGWDSTMFGPYFVVGAVYSGAGAVITAMWILRKTLHLEEYILPTHFRRLGMLLLVATGAYLYFNLNEYLTVGYKLEGADRTLVQSLFVGRFAALFWSTQVLGVLVPIILMALVVIARPSECCTIKAIGIAATLVMLGAWTKRLLIVVPALQTPFLPSQHLPATWTAYHPTGVEWSVFLGACAAFLLAFTLLAKFFPIVSFWETRESAPLTVTETRGASAASTQPGPARSALPLAMLLVLAFAPRAAASHRQPAPTQITLAYVSMPGAQPETAPHNPATVHSFPDLSRALQNPLVSLFPSQDEPPVPAILLTATVRDATGASVQYKAVTFSEKTLFGTLALGSRPTDDHGLARLRISSRRYGAYRVQATLAGDDDDAPSSAEIVIQAASRPAPRLPVEGVFIAPYPTAWISVPFVLFFGGVGACVIYAFGYLILYRMRTS